LFRPTSAKARAEQAVHYQQVIRLTEESQVRFAEMMFDPTPLNRAMEEAIAKHDQMIDLVRSRFE
jgi:uncharacterized protein (DUF1778 family)